MTDSHSLVAGQLAYFSIRANTELVAVLARLCERAYGAGVDLHQEKKLTVRRTNSGAHTRGLEFQPRVSELKK